MVKLRRNINLEDKLDEFIEECKKNREENKHGERDLLYLNTVKAFEGRGAYEIAVKCVNWMYSRRHQNLWIGITGSWDNLHQSVIEDVAQVTRYILAKGYGISVGGSPGVPFVATDIVLREGDPYRAKNQLIVSLPVPLEPFLDFYERASSHEVALLARSQGKSVARQLEYLRDNFQFNIFDNTPIDVIRFLNPKNQDYRHPENQDYRKSAYYLRNSLEGYCCDGVIPFCVVADSEDVEESGVMNTRDHVSALLKPVFTPFIYEISKSGEKVIRNYAEINIPGLQGDYPLPFYPNTFIDEEITQ